MNIKENDPPILYDLFAVSNHYGSMSGGHYTAYGLNSKNQSWYEFDDRSVNKIYDENDIVTSAAYVLLYRKRR